MPLRTLSVATFLLLLSMPAAAGSAVAVPDIDCYSDEAEQVTRSALENAAYWGDAEVKTYNNKNYDQIRLKPTDDGWVPMISGEGQMDFRHEVVAETVFFHQNRLEQLMSGAKAVRYLDRGYDNTIGAEYADAYFMLDLTVFYATFTQRMYKKTEGETTVLWFEQLRPEMVTPAKWASYAEKQKQIEDSLSLRWAFGSVLRLSDVYGMFVVQPGDNRSTRITFVSKMEFGEDAGFIAQVGSQMRSVIRAGLKSGFDACVQVATNLQNNAPAPAPKPAPAPEQSESPSAETPTSEP